MSPGVENQRDWCPGVRPGVLEISVRDQEYIEGFGEFIERLRGSVAQMMRDLAASFSARRRIFRDRNVVKKRCRRVLVSARVQNMLLCF